VFETLLIFHFLGLALGVGTSFAIFTLGKASADMEPAERVKFMLRASVLAKNGSAGLGLLILSGLGMLFQRGVLNTLRWGGGAFHAKLTLVVILCGVVGYMQVLLKRARLAGGGPNMQKLPKIGQLGLLLSVSIVILAVIAFK
jgi:uncharacterized membrane protein